MRISIKLWRSVLTAAAAVAVVPTAAAMEIQDTSALPPPFIQKAKGPMAKADTALGRLLGEYMAHRERGEPGPFTPSNEHLLYAPGRVGIDVIAAGDPAGLLEDLRGLGLINGAQYGSVISGLIPIGAIERIARLDSVRAMQASWRPITNVGLVTSEGVYAMGADFVTQTGVGSVVGVLSDSFDHQGDADADQANGDLPASVMNLDDSANCGNILVRSPCSDEGRAMMQLAHDVAPGASMAFHTAFTGEANFAQGIRDLAVAGADIIVDDVMYFAEPMFQDGIIAQAIDDVVAGGVAYFSAAGNGARKSYEASFSGSGEPLYVDTLFGLEYRGEMHDFDPDPGVVDWRQGLTIPAGATIYVALQWDQPSSAVAPGNGSRSDVDVYLVNSDFLIVASSIADNISSGVPSEILAYTNSSGADMNADLLITHFDGPEAALIKYVLFGGLNVTIEHATDSPTLYGHANAAGAEAVGAAFYQKTPAYGVSPPELEYFSSAGGVPILFDRNGQALSAADLREKPEVVGPDGANTTFFYADSTRDSDTWPNFFGTSAASPHVAAVAALMREASPGSTPAEIYAALESTAVDMMDTGFDWDSGYGLVSARDAVVAIGGDPGGPLANQAPVADAGADQTVTLSGGTATVQLDGSNSSDPDCQPGQACPLTFHWTILSKPRKASTSLSQDQTAGTGSFTTDKAGTYELELSVSDGTASSIDTVVITVENPPKSGSGSSCNPKKPGCVTSGT